MKILLHICCGPCTVYPLKVLRQEGHDIEGFFYNPNIHPYTEFKKRLETLEIFTSASHLPLRVDRSYDLEAFLKGALERGEARCLFCYRMRLEKAFAVAKDEGFEAISTTLLYSKYQRHDDIVVMGNELARAHKVAFLYRDFRTGWREGQDESRRLNMYRQKYCGCIMSERNRYYR
jgi:predicted adenine nucleotide alpha hydrolase (AANH) superfamily ATPase